MQSIVLGGNYYQLSIYLRADAFNVLFQEPNEYTFCFDANKRVIVKTDYFFALQTRQIHALYFFSFEQIHFFHGNFHKYRPCLLVHGFGPL